MSNYTFIIDGKKADVSADIDLSIVLKGYDTEKENKNNYSYTIKFPFTYNNDLIFKRSNSLSYNSEFPYSEHVINILKNGVNYVNKGKLYLLATTDSYECAVTWGGYDYVKAITKNEKKLGVLLSSFPFVRWDYQYSEVRDADSYSNASTYGYINYIDKYGDDTNTYLFTNKHPLINLKYLLDSVFTELGINVEIPTEKVEFLEKLLKRPNKEYDINTNNVFEAHMRFMNHSVNVMHDYNYAFRFYHKSEGDLSPGSETLGNNSYYFKSWMDCDDGIDGVCPIPGWGQLPQSKRIKSFAKITGNVLEITDFQYVTGSEPLFCRYRPSDQTMVVLYHVTGLGTYTFDSEIDDWYFFGCLTPGITKFDIKITSPIDDTLTKPNPLYFPSKFHIPTCIDLTVGEFVTECLNLTCSDLTYDINSDTYYFENKLRQNENIYDLTENIIRIKDVKYDAKYIYNKIAKKNIFKYLNDEIVGGYIYDSKHIENVDNDKLADELIIYESVFSTSGTLVDSPNTGIANILEHEYVAYQQWTKFVEQPLHLFYNDTLNSTINFHSEISMSNIFSLFYTEWFDSLKTIALTGTIRTLTVEANITDVEFKRINPLGLIYIKTFGKYYGVIEIFRNGYNAEFLLLELY